MLAARSDARVREIPSVRRRHGYNSRTHTLSEPPRGGNAERNHRHDKPFPRHESVAPIITRWHCALALSLGVLAACESSPPPLPAIRVTVPVPEDRVLSSFAASADGARIAYSAESVADGRRRIYVVETSDPTAERELPDTIGASSPFFSPDGSSLAYFSRGAIWRVAVAEDREPVRVADAPVESAGGTWTADDRIVFAPLGTSGLMAVPAAGGGATALTEVNGADGELEHGWPHALSDGSTVFTVSERGRDAHIEVLSPEKQRTRLRVPIVGHAQYVQTGHLVYSFLGNLMAVRFNRRGARHRRCTDGGGEGDADVRRIRRAGAIGVLGLADRHARVAARRRTGCRQPARARRARRKSFAAVGASRMFCRLRACLPTAGDSRSWSGRGS